MRFFKTTKAHFLADNSNSTPVALIKRYDRALLRNEARYHKYLETIADRLGPRAYKFFQFGFAETGLHDAYLLSCSFGDAIDESEQARAKLRFGSGKSILRMTMLTYGKDWLHHFSFRGLRRVLVDIPSDVRMHYHEGSLGQIYSYEVVSASPKYLRCEWLLDSGGTIVIESQKIDYSCKRVKPSPKRRYS